MERRQRDPKGQSLGEELAEYGGVGSSERTGLGEGRGERKVNHWRKLAQEMKEEWYSNGILMHNTAYSLSEASSHKTLEEKSKKNQKNWRLLK